MYRSFLIGLSCLTFFGCSSQDSVTAEPLGAASQALTAQPKPDAVGLSLRIQNGVSAPLSLVLSGPPRFVQELDISQSVATPDDLGIDPLIASGPWSSLDWTGVTQVEEIWVPSLDGTFTRERYFRNARWMEKSSKFDLAAIDANGHQLGCHWKVRAGRDDRARHSDDAFVRRFVARQSAFGCASVEDCSGASYVAEALVQVRGALEPQRDARPLPGGTAALRLSWNRLPSVSYDIAVAPVAASDAEFSPGFQVELEPATPPANGDYYVSGETVSFRVTFRDGEGNRLHPEGQLPTYQEYLTGQATSGLRYLDLQLQSRLYYALKHRESNLFAVLSGPTDELTTPQTVVDPTLFFGPQVPFATRAVDGYTAVGQTVPPAAIVFGGFADPSLWALPVSDLLSFTIPLDAEPGTYVAAIKARREYLGEALNRGTTVEIPVGTAVPTTFVAKTTCASCHQEGTPTAFDTALHGMDDRRSCFGCHSSLGIEFDNAIDIRVHTIHDRSDRFDADINDCSVCHTSPPTGPARGLLPQ